MNNDVKFKFADDFGDQEASKKIVQNIIKRRAMILDNIKKEKKDSDEIEIFDVNDDRKK